MNLAASHLSPPHYPRASPTPLVRRDVRRHLAPLLLYMLRFRALSGADRNAAVAARLAELVAKRA